MEKSFKKDFQRDKQQGGFNDKDFELLRGIIEQLQKQENIHQKYKRHPLKGKLKGFESIHVKFNWVLIIRVSARYLDLVMLGSHTQVYKKF